jgi:hypothetical protein
MRLGEPQSRSRRGDEEINSQLLPGLEPPIIQPVAQRYVTELSDDHKTIKEGLHFRNVTILKKGHGLLTAIFMLGTGSQPNL